MIYAQVSAIPTEYLSEDYLVVIPCFNQLFYLKNTIAQLSKYGLSKFLLLDNGSTYPALLEWYTSCPYPVVIDRSNPGPRAFYIQDNIWRYLPSLFFVTDPDLQYNEEMPINFKEEMLRISEENNWPKIALALDISEKEQMHPKVRHWERDYWSPYSFTTSTKDTIYKAKTDTTFALYNKKYFTATPNMRWDGPFFTSPRIGDNYTCKHWGWYKVQPVPEEEQYLYKVTSKHSSTLDASVLPKTAIIIPTKDKLELLFKCLHSINKHVKADVHIFIADTGSTEDNLKLTEDYIATKVNHPCTLIKYLYYHFAKINNDVVRKYANDYAYLVFMNNDIELCNDAVSLMLDFNNKHKDIGTLGARLHFPYGSIQHAGMIIIKGKDKLDITHRAHKQPWRMDYQEVDKVLGNTAALMGIAKDVFNEVGGFPEYYNTAFEDVELNVNCLLKGKTNYFLGHIAAIHAESVTRKVANHIHNKEDFSRVRDYLSSKLSYIPKEFIVEKRLTLSKAEWSFERSNELVSEFDMSESLQYQNPAYPDVYEKQCKFEQRYDMKSDNGNLHVVLMGNSSVCGKIRLAMPAKYLNRVPGIEVFPSFMLTPELINWAHMIVWEAGITPQAFPMVEFLDKMGVPQIWEADDNYYNIGPYNKASYLLDRDNVPKWLKLCKNATVTRKELGEFYKTLYPELKYHILPNSVDFEVWPKATYTTGDILKGDKLRLGWTGCDSHRDDLAIVIPALKQLKNKYKDKLEIVIFGWNGELDPKFNMPNVFEGLDITHYGPVIYEEYANKLCSLNLDVAFIPLANNTFNNTGKSNLKYLDVSASRIPCAVSDCNLYGDTKDMETGIIVKDSEWFDKLDMLLRDRELRIKLSNNAYNYVHDTYDMAKTVHLWTNAYMECASKYKIS